MKTFSPYSRLSLISLSIITGLLICFSAAWQSVKAQPPKKEAPTPNEVSRLKAALTLDNVQKGLSSDKVSLPERNQLLIQAVKARGIAFAMPSEIEKQLTEQGASKALIETIRKESTKFGDATYYYINLGDTFRIQANFAEAIANYTKAIEIDPNSRVAYNNRGDIYKRMGDNFKKLGDTARQQKNTEEATKNYAEANNSYDKAIADFTETIRIDPTGRSGYNNRGTCYYEKLTNNNREEAIANGRKAVEDFTKAIEIDPKFRDAYTNRAMVYRYTLGEKDKADADEQKLKDLRAGTVQPAPTESKP